jgi:hypothetical protein
MLLSMYASYHWARTDTLRSYLLKVILFIVGVSFWSVIFPVTWFFLFLFPFLFLTFLSWPAIFYSGLGDYVRPRWINFLTLNISTSDTLEYVIIAFSVSIFVNILGALLGYLIYASIKKLRIQFPSNRWWKILWISVGIICVVPYLGGLFVPQLMNVFYPLMPWNSFTSIYLLGFGFILLDTIILSELLENGQNTLFQTKESIH